ncbi:hypothetical protein PM082_019516 [Marasmius tenuissimus]|nr:hypothetical protein PM082_019516 [Marasmius tenuissimus]
MAESVCLIPGNPDIGGIGVRAAVYIQACLTALTAVFTIALGHAEDCRPKNSTSQDSISLLLFLRHRPSYDENMKTLERSIYMIGVAILISAFIELHIASGITIYDALIVLNISLINLFAGALIGLVRGGELGVYRRWRSLDWHLAWSHSTLVGAFGLHFLCVPKSFLAYIPTEAPPCRSVSDYWFFVPVDTAVAWHPFGLIFCVLFLFFLLTAIPIVGMHLPYYIIVVLYIVWWTVAFLLALFIISTSRLFRCLTKPTFSLPARPALDLPRTTPIAQAPILQRLSPKYIATRLRSASSFSSEIWYKVRPARGVVLILPPVFLIVSTEEMVKLYSPYLIERENSWTYGQTLALCSALGSTVLCVYEWWKMWVTECRVVSEMQGECQKLPTSSTPSRDLERGIQQDTDSIYPLYDYLG